MRLTVKSLLHRICQLLVLPLGVLCWLEAWLSSSRSETLFHICTQLVALLPGLPGAFLRRAFYTLSLDDCSAHCHIGFGTLFSHRQAAVGDHVYIGSYALLGSVALGAHALIGSRVSILSGSSLHVLQDNGRWSPYEAERLEQVRIGANAWIGEAAVLAADIGTGAMVCAGAVVTTPVRDAVVVAGNPARFVRKLEAEADAQKDSEKAAPKGDVK